MRILADQHSLIDTNLMLKKTQIQPFFFLLNILLCIYVDKMVCKLSFINLNFLSRHGVESW